MARGNFKDRGRGGGGGRRGGGGRNGSNHSGYNGRPVREIVFDKDQREQYLTGFHKRNVERKEKAQERAKVKAREERLEERKILREQRKAELEEHVERTSELIRNQQLLNHGDDSESEGSDEEWSGISDSETATTADTNVRPKPILRIHGRQVQTYESEANIDSSHHGENDDNNHNNNKDNNDNKINIDNDEEVQNLNTTVIIEEYDAENEDNEQRHDDDRVGNKRHANEDVLKNSLRRAAFYAKRVEKINKGIPVAPKIKKKKFRYLTPLERKANKKKERAASSRPRR
ncbi:nucleolar protein 12-domain-containing protein [Lipomyces japonicus]|uniref:nucleolar protein 12-domain-containing protein n=1 Tax=Lipomyces japonicus TaxID=56871 RepID=UPI0034CDD13A